MTSMVTIVPYVEAGNGITQYQSVTEYQSVVAGDIPADLLLMSNGLLLLMTGGSLTLV